jgi:hypothetical protein
MSMGMFKSRQPGYDSLSGSWYLADLTDKKRGGRPVEITSTYKHRRVIRYRYINE